MLTLRTFNLYSVTKRRLTGKTSSWHTYDHTVFIWGSLHQSHNVFSPNRGTALVQIMFCNWLLWLESGIMEIKRMTRIWKGICYIGYFHCRTVNKGQFGPLPPYWLCVRQITTRRWSAQRGLIMKIKFDIYIYRSFVLVKPIFSDFVI